METSRDATLRLARKYAAAGRPDAWFEEFYALAEGDHEKVYWARSRAGASTWWPTSRNTRCPADGRGRHHWLRGRR